MLLAKGSHWHRPRRYDTVLRKGVELGQQVKQAACEHTLIEYVGGLVVAAKLHVLHVCTGYKLFRTVSKEYHSSVCRAMTVHIVQAYRCHLFFQTSVVSSQHVSVNGFGEVAIAYHVNIQIRQLGAQTRSDIECSHVGRTSLCQYSFLVLGSDVASGPDTHKHTTTITDRCHRRRLHLTDKQFTFGKLIAVNAHGRYRQYVAIRAKGSYVLQQGIRDLEAGLYFTVVLSAYYQIAVLVRAGQIIGERTDSLTELVFITSGHCTLYSVCLSALQELS